MKKILLSALFAATAFAGANAQMYVGGTVGLETSKAKGASAVTNVSIAPEIGYMLTKELALGLEVSYKHSGNYSDELLPAGTYKGNTFRIAPYVRYNFSAIGKFVPFIDGKLSFATTGMKTEVSEVTEEGIPVTSTVSVNDNVNEFGITFEPGVAFNVTEDVTIVAKTVNLLGYHHRWFGDYSVNKFGIGASSLGITFGAYYNF